MGAAQLYLAPFATVVGDAIAKGLKQALNRCDATQVQHSAVESGRLAYLAGRMPKKLYADPSSPLAGLI